MVERIEFDIRIEETKLEKVTINLGIRQACVMFPMLFNLYSEMVFNEALHELEQGIHVNGDKLNNLR